MTLHRIGRSTILLPHRPRIVCGASIVGKKEGEGPLSNDFDTIIDHADFYEPFKPNEGIHQVYMLGQLVLENNERTGISVGKCLKRGQ